MTDAVAAALQKVKKEELEDEEEEDMEIGEEEMMDWALATLKRTQYLSESSSEEEKPIRAPSKYEPSPSAGQSSHAQVSEPSGSGLDSGSVVQGEQANSAHTTSDHKALKSEPCETEVYFPQMSSEDPSVDPLSVPVKEESPTSSTVKKEENNEDGTAELVTPDPLPVPECPKAEAEPVLAACLQCVKTEPPTEEQDPHEVADAEDICELGGETKQIHDTSMEFEQPTSSVSRIVQNIPPFTSVIAGDFSESFEQSHLKTFAPQEPLDRRIDAQMDVQFVDLGGDSDGEEAMDVDRDRNSFTEDGVSGQYSSFDAGTVHSKTDNGECSILQSPIVELDNNKNKKSASGRHRWKCICDQHFTTRHELKIHLKTHFIDGKWRCCFCDMSFTLLCTLAAHRKTHSRYVSVDRAGQELPSSSPVSRILEPVKNISRAKSVISSLSHSIPPLADDSPVHHNCVCNICDKRFRIRQDLDEHRMTHCVNGMWSCCFCDKVFTHLCGLTNHTKTHCKQEECSAMLSGAAQKSSSDVPVSLTVERVENISPDTSAQPTNANENWVCSICDKNFSSSQDLEKHCKTHFIDGRWKCCFCDKAYTRRWRLTNHRKTHSRHDFPVHHNCVCNICDKRFGIRQDLDEHRMTHITDGMWMCCFCDRAFTDLCGLTNHRKTHCRQEECSVVLNGATLESSSDIPDSSRVEPLENISPDTSAQPTNANENWVCNICDKNFSSSQDLEIHCKTHFIDGKWKCCFCDKAYTRRWRLTNHRKTHSRHDSPEDHTCVCNICDKRFRIRQDLDEHRMTHCVDGMWMCCFCDKSFTHLCALTCHKKTWCIFKTSSIERAAVAQVSSSIAPPSRSVAPPSSEDIPPQLIELNSDENENNAAENWEWVCNICDKNFISFRALSKHRRTHFISESETVAQVSSSNAPPSRIVAPASSEHIPPPLFKL